jgi:hypothetical protein
MMNWDDAICRSRLRGVAQVSIPADDGGAGERVMSIPPIFEWTASGTEKFLGRDNALSQSSLPRQRRTWSDPINLFGAARCGRANANPSGARSVRQCRPHREATNKA